MLPRLGIRLKRPIRRLLRFGVRHGMPPAWAGYRFVPKNALEDLLLCRDATPGSVTPDFQVVHPGATAAFPLPRNIPRRGELSDDRGWWGYALRDVPSRQLAPTILAELRGCRVLPFVDPVKKYLRPAILDRRGHSVEMREISFRAMHTDGLRASGRPVRRRRATWLCERVYHNHAHWLTGHLPKLLFLRDRGELDDVLIPSPSRRTPVMERSMERLGLDPADFDTFDPARPLEVAELRVLDTDRFRPELLRPVRRALDPPAGAGELRVFISRSGAPHRRVVNEDEIWPVLEAAGFRRVRMEELDFDEQVDLMQRTAVLVAPHGAGLTNMMFCPEGTPVVEVLDPAFPNPNFYALACAMGHPYWLLEGEGVGDGKPGWRDMRVDPDVLEQAVHDAVGSCASPGVGIGGP